MEQKIIIGTMRWGSWGKNLLLKDATDLIEFCYDNEMKTFDLADIYGAYTTENFFGDAFKTSHISRESLYLITKCGIQNPGENANYKIKAYNTTSKYIIQQTEQSLQNIQTDYIDELLIHRPSPLMHPEEIAEAYFQLHKAGKIKKLGVSNFSHTQFSIMNEYIPLSNNQVELSLSKTENLFNDTLLSAIKYKFQPQIWSPLGSYFTESSERNNKIQARVIEISEKYSVTETEILLSWVMQHPSKPNPIIGSTDKERISLAKKSLDVILENEDWFTLLETSRGHRVA